MPQDPSLRSWRAVSVRTLTTLCIILLGVLMWLLWSHIQYARETTKLLRRTPYEFTIQQQHGALDVFFYETPVVKSTK